LDLGLNLLELLDDVPLQFLPHPWFQHDAAPMYYSKHAQQGEDAVSQ
jgi:hypothetical protein